MPSKGLHKQKERMQREQKREKGERKKERKKDKKITFLSAKTYHLKVTEETKTNSVKVSWIFCEINHLKFFLGCGDVPFHELGNHPLRDKFFKKGEKGEVNKKG